MDILRGNTVIKLVAVSLIVITLLGCKTHKIVSENTVSESKETFNRTELVVKEQPFKLESVQQVVFDSIGDIIPIKLIIKKNGVVGEILLNNKELKYTLESKDTIDVYREVKEIIIRDVNKSEKTIIEKQKTFFQKIGQYLKTIIVTIVVLLFMYLVFRIIRKFYYPI